MAYTLITHSSGILGSSAHPREYALFKELGPAELEKLTELSKLKVVSEKQYLLTQYSPVTHVFNLASGTALVERISSAGRRQVLAFLFPGDFVGLTHSDHYEYGVKCLTDMTAYAFKLREFRKLADDTPQLKKNMQEIGANVLGHALDQVFILGQKKAEERLCFLFMQLLGRLPGATPDSIHLPMTRQDMADYLGLTVETVSRALAKLKSDKLIAIPSPQTLVLLQYDLVRELGDIE